MKKFTMFTIVLLGGFAAGCGTTPASVCGKLKELDALPAGGGVDGCEVQWSRRKSDKPDKYAAEAQCVMAATSKADLGRCSQ